MINGRWKVTEETEVEGWRAPWQSLLLLSRLFWFGSRPEQLVQIIICGGGNSEVQELLMWERVRLHEVLLRELYSHGLTPSNTLCVNLEPGTTVIWDNRMVLHRSTPQKEYLAAKQERLMHRVFVVQDTGESGISEEAEGDTSLSPKM